MRSAVLRLYRSNWRPEFAAFCAKPESVWRAGEKALLGKVHSDSGAIFSVSDAPTIQRLLSDIREFFEFNGANVGALVAEGVVAELDVGVTVGDSEQFTASIPFEPADLSLLAKLGISLRVSAYPTSDEATAQSV